MGKTSRAHLLLVLSCALGLPGCYAAAELGYTNTLRPRGGGGGTVTVRAGTGPLPNREAAAGIDLALRAEAATSGSRVSWGPSVLLALPNGSDDRLLPFARPSVWLAAYRWDRAGRDFFVTPSLDVGLMTTRKSETNSRTLFTFGARLEYLGRGDPLDRAFGGTLYFGYGSSDGPGKFTCRSRDPNLRQTSCAHDADRELAGLVSRPSD